MTNLNRADVRNTADEDGDEDARNKTKTVKSENSGGACERRAGRVTGAISLLLLTLRRKPAY